MAPAATTERISASTSVSGLSRSRPRTDGTMQNVQVLLQPMEIDTQAEARWPRTAGRSLGKPVSSRVILICGFLVARALSSSCGSASMVCVPKTASTQGSRLRMASRSFWAMQPPTAIWASGLRSLKRCQRPSVPYMRSVAFWRTAHVLSTTRSTSPALTCSPLAGVYPSVSSTPAMRSESATFIWHPSVRMAYRPLPRFFAGAAVSAAFSSDVIWLSSTRAIIRGRSGPGFPPAPKRSANVQRTP